MVQVLISVGHDLVKIQVSPKAYGVSSIMETYTYGMGIWSWISLQWTRS